MPARHHIPPPFNPAFMSGEPIAQKGTCQSIGLEGRVPVECLHRNKTKVVQRDDMVEDTCPSAGKSRKKYSIDVNRDTLSLVIAKFTRKLSPKSANSKSFFRGSLSTPYDVFIKCRYNSYNIRWTKSRTITLVLLLFLLFCSAVIFLGAAVERSVYAKLGSGVDIIRSNAVCRMHLDRNSEWNIPRIAFHTDYKKDEKQKGFIAHCGPCGYCSTEADIQIYHNTAKTFKKDTMQCAMKAFFGGKSLVKKCLDDRLGLTPACHSCWVDNAICEIENCLFSCLKSLFFEEGGLFGDLRKDIIVIPDDKDVGYIDDLMLNSCLSCTEAMCTSSLLECAGVNRRRAGIATNIARDHEEICQLPTKINYNF